MRKTFRILEIIWLIMGCVGVLMCAYSIMAKDNRSTIYFLVITFAGGLMYSVRRRQRIRYEEALKKQEEAKSK